MNVLKREKQVFVISMLVEGCSIRSVERITGIHRDTIMRLMVRVGEHCQNIADDRMRGLSLECVEADEIWCYVAKKQKRVRPGDPVEYGDTYTFVSMDADSKLIPWFTVGKRDSDTTHEFIAELADRLDGDVEIFTDGWGAYRDAIPRHFGDRAAFSQVIKYFDSDPDAHRYSPPKVTHVEERWVQGRPRRRASTSYVERGNWTIRTHLRRFTRLSNGFSRKLRNLKAAVALYFAWYNFVRIHGTLRVTPAMAAGITGSFWTIEQLLPTW